MNTIIDPTLDKSNPLAGSAQLSCSKALQQCTLDLNLCQSWGEEVHLFFPFLFPLLLSLKYETQRR